MPTSARATDIFRDDVGIVPYSKRGPVVQGEPITEDK